MNIGVGVDDSWGLRGWAQKQGIVDVCFEDTGKVLHVILKTSYCKVCKNLKLLLNFNKVDFVTALFCYITYCHVFDRFSLSMVFQFIVSKSATSGDRQKQPPEVIYKKVCF